MICSFCCGVPNRRCWDRGLSRSHIRTTLAASLDPRVSAPMVVATGSRKSRRDLHRRPGYRASGCVSRKVPGNNPSTSGHCTFSPRAISTRAGCPGQRATHGPCKLLLRTDSTRRYIETDTMRGMSKQQSANAPCFFIRSSKESQDTAPDTITKRGAVPAPTRAPPLGTLAFGTQALDFFGFFTGGGLGEQQWQATPAKQVNKKNNNDSKTNETKNKDDDSHNKDNNS